MIRFSEDSAAEGFQAMLRADFNRAIALLHNLDARGCAASRARIYLLLLLPQRAIAEFEQAESTRLHPRELAELMIVAWTAFRLIGDHERAAIVDKRLAGLCESIGDPLLNLSYVSVTIFHLMGFDGDLAAAKTAVARALPLAERCRGVEAESPYLPDGNHLCSRLYNTAASLAWIQGEIAEHERLLVDAILTAELVAHRDVFLDATLLSNLALRLFLSPSHSARELLLSRARTIPWNNHIDELRTRIRRGLRTNKEIFGWTADVEAFGLPGFPTMQGRLGDCVDRLLYSDWADRSTFASEIAFAIELAERIDWITTSGHEIADLALISALSAPRNLDLSEGLMARYYEKIESLSGLMPYLRERRRGAIESFVRGAIAKGRGEMALATSLFAQSQAYWLEKDVAPMAAIVGLERYTMSRDERDLDSAAAFSRTYPTTSLARRIGRAMQCMSNTEPMAFPFLDQS